MSKKPAVLVFIAALIVGAAVTMAFKPGYMGVSYAPEITKAPANMTLARSELSAAMTVLDGYPKESGSGRLGVSHDDSSYATIWECSPGRFSWDYGWDETVYLLEGHVTLYHNGQAQEVRGGDLVTFHAGSQVVWDIHEKVRKLAFLHRPSLVGKIRKWAKS